jgi:hypothetical protein
MIGFNLHDVKTVIRAGGAIDRGAVVYYYISVVNL